MNSGILKKYPWILYNAVKLYLLFRRKYDISVRKSLPYIQRKLLVSRRGRPVYYTREKISQLFNTAVSRRVFSDPDMKYNFYMISNSEDEKRFSLKIKNKGEGIERFNAKLVISPLDTEYNENEGRISYGIEFKIDKGSGTNILILIRDTEILYSVDDREKRQASPIRGHVRQLKKTGLYSISMITSRVFLGKCVLKVL